MIRFAEKTQLTAPINNWGPYYIKRAQAVIDGTWKSEDVWGGLASDMLHMAPYRNMPDDVMKLAQSTEADIKSGKLKPFGGKLKDQSGGEKSVADDGAIASMNWLVQGVDGKLPS
jgi:simple sugar transport system substrate-binding protein